MPLRIEATAHGHGVREADEPLHDDDACGACAARKRATLPWPTKVMAMEEMLLMGAASEGPVAGGRCPRVLGSSRRKAIIDSKVRQRDSEGEDVHEHGRNHWVRKLASFYSQPPQTRLPYKARTNGK